mmetsp:Transcript_13950/g.24692  ORF Transcript_13950/g.24692 Transcript_13950/m.24692 type:complete len:94 (-) Transcript_13950:261-542(-)
MCALYTCSVLLYSLFSNISNMVKRDRREEGAQEETNKAIKVSNGVHRGVQGSRGNERLLVEILFFGVCLNKLIINLNRLDDIDTGNISTQRSR